MNLLEILRDSVGKVLIERVPSLLGLSIEEAQTAVSRLLPSLLGGMVYQSGTEPGAMRLFDALTSAEVKTSLLDEAEAVLRGGADTSALSEQGIGLLGNLFGHRAAAVEQGVREASGLSESASRSLLGLALPFVAARLKQLIGAEHLDLGGFVNLLSSQRGLLEHALDARFLKALGIGSLGDLFSGVGQLGSRFASGVRGTAEVVARPAVAAGASTDAAAGGGGLLWKILPWVVLLLLALWLLTMCKKPMQHELSSSGQPPATAETKAPAERAGDLAKDAAAMVTEAAKSVGSAVGDGAKGAVDTVADAAKNTVAAASEGARAAAETTGVAASAVAEGAKAVGGAVADAAQGVEAEAAGVVAAGGDALRQGAASAVDSARGSGEAAAEAAKELVGAVGAVADKVMAKIRGVTLPDGTRLELSEGSPVDRIVSFLNQKEATLPKAFILEGLNFETASAKISADSQKIIDDLAKTLKAYPRVKVRMEGHTDDRGSAANNKRLSAARAAAVRTVLMEQGIVGDRIATAGFGPAKPLADNATEEGRARNRRVEVIITAK